MSDITRSSGGRRTLDPQQRSQLAAWAAEVRARIDERRDGDPDNRLDVKQLATSLGVARSTLINWLAGESPPDPWAVQRIGEELSFPLDHQLALLGWRPASALPYAAAWSFGPAGTNVQFLPMLTQLRRAISELEESSGRIADLSQGAGERVASVASQLVDSALVYGEGRWESRTSIHHDGVRYPVLRETFIEFGLCEDVVPLSWDELHDRYGSYMRERAPDLYLPAEGDDATRDRIKRERLEIRALLDYAGAATRLDGTFFGEAGSRWESVARLTREINGRRWTHLFSLNDSSPRVASEQPALVRGGEVTAILLVAPTYLTARVVGRLVARALDWRDVSHDQLTTATWGRPRDGVAGERLRQLTATARDWLSAPPTTPTVFSVIRHHIFARDPELASRALTVPNVLSVIVTPDENVLDAWEQQQIDNTFFSGGPSLAGLDEMARANEALLQGFPQSHPSVIRLPFHLESVEPVSALNFRDPRICDEQVRIAERIRLLLDAGPAPETELAGFRSRLESDPLVGQRST